MFIILFALTGIIINCYCRDNRQTFSNDPGKYVVGGGTLTTLSPDVVFAANDYLSGTARFVPFNTYKKMRVFYRVELNGCLIYSACYGRVKNRNSYSISYEVCDHQCFGQIQFFVAVPELDSVLAIVQKLVPISETVQQHFGLSTPAICTQGGICCVTRLSSVVVIDVNMIKRKCLCVDVGCPTMYVFCVPFSMQD